jgi:hypothetical protein
MHAHTHTHTHRGDVHFASQTTHYVRIQSNNEQVNVYNNNNNNNNNNNLAMTEDSCITESFFKYVVRIRLTKKKETEEKCLKGQCKLANKI